MTVVFEAPGVTVHHGDCIEIMRTLPDASVDAIVTDPPYGLEFMGKDWDSFKPSGTVQSSITEGADKSHPFRDGSTRIRYGMSDLVGFQAWCTEWAREAFRVLKPGGHMLAFGGSRTWHRLASGIEDAGFEIRDSIAWLYGSGFPKSLDVSKAIDNTLGVQREVVGRAKGAANGSVVGLGEAPSMASEYDVTAPASDAAKAWEGWGTALKPAFEPIVVARKPLAGTVAANVLAHGTGALNIAANRVGDEERDAQRSTGVVKSGNSSMAGPNTEREVVGTVVGRWPTNVVIDDHTAAELDQQSGVSVSGKDRGVRGRGGIWSPSVDGIPAGPQYGDSGGASRFFPVFRYEAKAGSDERPNVNEVQHPTVKPLDLMRWLVRLVTPPDGTILEPFAGSGTTLEAALLEGFTVIGIEREADYLPLIEARLTKPLQPVMFGDWEGGAA